MDNQTIQALIYDQLYAGAFYDAIADLTNDPKQKNQMMAFSADSYNNARYLEKYYEELNTSSFNPIISEPPNTGDFYESVLAMIAYNGRSSRLFINQTFNELNDTTIKNITGYINAIIMQHNTLLTQIYLQQNFYTKKTSPM